MIRVMQVLTDTNIGGAGIWLLNFLKAYDRDKLDVTVVLPEQSRLKERVESLNVRCIEAQDIADCSFSIGGIKALRAIIDEEEPDIVHTHASLSARIAAKLSGVMVVNTRHCLEPKKGGIKRICYRILNRLLSDRAIAVSGAVYNNLLADGISKDRLDIIYNGVEPLEEYSEEKRAEVREKYGLDGKLAVGIFARLEPVKNHFLLLNAAAAAYELFPDFRFVIVGEGSMEKALRQTAEAHGLSDAVIFTGYVGDVTELMNAIDINVLTSDREAMSISLVEGMTLAKPCITTDAGGPREVVENGKSGIVIPTGDAVNLTAALLKLASDPRMRTGMGVRGREIAKEKFGLDEMCKRLLKVYESMCKEGDDDEEA